MESVRVVERNWEGTEKEQFNVCKWVEELQKRLQTIRDHSKGKHEINL